MLCAAAYHTFEWILMNLKQAKLLYKRVKLRIKQVCIILTFCQVMMYIVIRKYIL